jgi:hypothetical protein
MSHALITLITAVAVGFLSGLGADVLAHASTLSSIVFGVLVGGGAFITGTLGTTKTILDILKTKKDLQKLDARVTLPSEQQIRKYGGIVYRQITRAAHLRVTEQEQISAKTFVVDVKEEISGRPDP